MSFILTKNGYKEVDILNDNLQFQSIGFNGWYNINFRKKTFDCYKIKFVNNIEITIPKEYYIYDEYKEIIKVENLKLGQKIYKPEKIYNDNLIHMENEIIKKLIYLIDNFGKVIQKKFEARYISITFNDSELSIHESKKLKFDLLYLGFDLDFKYINKKRNSNDDSNIYQIQFIIKSDDLNKLFIDMGFELQKLKYDKENNIDSIKFEYYIISNIDSIKSDFLYEKNKISFTINNILISNFYLTH